MPSLKWLRHAFAVETAAPVRPTPEQQAVIDRVCRTIVAKNLTIPAIAFLEMSRPLGFVGAQAIHFFTPLVSAIGDPASMQHFAAFLEQRQAVDYLLKAIEHESAAARPPASTDGEQ